MVSELFLGDYEELEKEGIKLSPQEIIRLNSLALKAEKNERSSDLFAMPRIAKLGNSIIFHEPTLGDQIFFDNVFRIFDDDLITLLTIESTTLTKKEDQKLPDYFNPDEVQNFVKTNITKFQPFTISQIVSCLDWVKNGNNHIDNEFPHRTDDKKDDEENNQETYSIAIGYLMVGKKEGLISFDEANKLTVRQMKQLIQEKFEQDERFNKEVQHNRYISEYYTTLDFIKDTHNVRQSN